MKAAPLHLFSLIVTICAVQIVFAQQSSFYMGYQYGNPGTDMRQTISNTHALQMGMLFPIGNKGFELGADLAFGGYGRQVTDQDYRFENGDYMLAPVTVSNNMQSGALMARYTLPMTGAVVPFAQARLGLTRMGTRLTIEDPRAIHTDECPLPLVDDLLQSGHSFTQGLGVGLRFDMGKVFQGLGSDKYFLVLTADYLRGSVIEYMSVNPPSFSFNTGEGVESVTLPFASRAQPTVEHSYHSGYLYKTRLELTQLAVNFMVRF